MKLSTMWWTMRHAACWHWYLRVHLEIMPLNRGDRVAQDSPAPEEGIYPVRGKGCEGKRQKEAHTHHSCGMINPQLKNIKQVQLVDNASDSSGACCLLAIQSFHKTNKHAEIYVGWGRVRHWSVPVRWQCKLTPSNVLCVRTNTISCRSEEASLVHWPSFSSRVLPPLPGWRQGSGGLSVTIIRNQDHSHRACSCNMNLKLQLPKVSRACPDPLGFAQCDPVLQKSS